MSKPCRCGSGKPRFALYDARGIFCNYVCATCVESKRARYRPEIFSDASYYTDEAIEEEA